MTEQVLAVRRMQDYIETHLDERISSVDLGAACSYSPWYAYRLFTQWLKRTPAEYIRRLRLSRSALLLRDAQRKVADVAFEVGFNSVDGYQRAFFSEFGCNPREYAAHPSPLYLFTPYKVIHPDKTKEKRMENSKTVFVLTVEKPARKALIKRGVTAADYYQYCAEVGCDVWGYLLSIKQAIGEPVGLWLPKEMIAPNTSEYVQGVEIDANDTSPVPEGLVAIDLPAATYLRFQGEPFSEDEYESAIDEVWSAIRKFDPATAGYAWDDRNPRIQLEPVGTRGYIELVPVKKTPVREIGEKPGAFHRVGLFARHPPTADSVSGLRSQM